jgi:hypothetical protein
MLLAQAHRSFLPVAHLFPFTDFESKNFTCHFGETRLLSSYEDLAVISLSVDEIAHVLVEVHLRKVLREHVHVTFEREPDADSLLICE